MSYKKYGVVAKNSAQGYIYISKQFSEVEDKLYGIHHFLNPREIDVVYNGDYEKAKTILDAEAKEIQRIHRIGMLQEGKRIRKRSSKVLD